MYMSRNVRHLFWGRGRVHVARIAVIGAAIKCKNPLVFSYNSACLHCTTADVGAVLPYRCQPGYWIMVMVVVRETAAAITISSAQVKHPVKAST